MELDQEEKDKIDGLIKSYNWLVGTVIVTIFLFLLAGIHPDFPPENIAEEIAIDSLSVSNDTLVENGIHVSSGLIADLHYQKVNAVCGSCHSMKLVTQNRATREGWKEIIVWMQETQKLWDLGPNESDILDYLSKNYGPIDTGRRKQLVVEEWYDLE